MPRGRHRHSPPLHRVLPSSAIAGVSLVCAAGPWLFTEAFVLRVLAAGAAVTAVAGAVVMRRWDTAAGKHVADLTRARASDEWRYDERVAELETDLDESRELRVKLEQKLRAKRTELAGLRNEHAALLRRYATAETERATALEKRRQLAIEASAPTLALPAARTAPDGAGTPDSPGAEDSSDAVEAPETVDAAEAVEPSEEPQGPDGSAEPGGSEHQVPASLSGADAIAAFTADDDSAHTESDATAETGAESGADASSEVFSPAGSSLFLRAGAALSRITDGPREPEGGQAVTASGSVALALPAAAPRSDAGPATGLLTDAPAPGESALDAAVKRDAAAKRDAARKSAVAKRTPATKDTPATHDTAASGEPTKTAPASEAGPSSGAVEEAGGAQGKPEAAREHQRAVAEAQPALPPAPVTRALALPASRAVPATPGAELALSPRAAHSAKPAKRSGHFTVPTAVAVVEPTAPVRRPSAEGGFDFFGTQNEASDAAAMEAVQNEDLADVVGQEALALHKAEAESDFKPATEGSHGVGQVIDLTEHDETEHIDIEGLRSAVS
ncbi:hypothetical protein [Streptomyces sp. NPDC002580]|uniref:hypothetical protein n=1 Tax=Streptomyces sp. NPDC002580 TaxID=3364653 RepID=UPI00367648C4